MGVFAKLAKGTIAPEPGHPGLEPLQLANSDGSLYMRTETNLPARCIDGRRPTTPYAQVVPCAPGGSLSLLVALAAARGITDPLWGADELSNRLTWYGSEGHIHAGPDDRSSGCGALDGLSTIIDYANEQEPLLREVAAELGLPVQVTYPLASLKGQQIDTPGIYRMFDEKPDTKLTPLRGVHQEIAIIVNHEKGTTIDQNVLDQIGNIDVFDVDAWSLEVAADWLVDNYNVDRKRVASALSAFTVATLAILARPTMKVLHHG
ncbi:MAG: hypothetical protein ACTHUY_03915 [Flaviflexus sp.]|uniref:hypothetical protein n=1 Tax=Flaviflexus sp. TaxID=1969482 RepID=UPI003F9225BD